MRAELYRRDAPEEVVAVATWDGREAHVEVIDETLKDVLGGLLRPTPVVVDDAAYRQLGASGASVLPPGTLEWFRAVVTTRTGEAGLSARFVPGVSEGGWDPAAAYRTFVDVVDRLDRAGGPDSEVGAGALHSEEPM